MQDNEKARPRKIISEALLLAAASGFSYAVAYAYRSGFASFFGLPPLLLTPTLGVVIQAGAAIIAALSFFWLLLYSFWGFLPRASSVVGRQLRVLLIVGFFFSLAFFSVLARSKWGWLIILGFLCVFGFGMFVFPLITQREVAGYENKLLAQQKIENAAQQRTLLDRIGERIGHKRMLLILAAILGSYRAIVVRAWRRLYKREQPERILRTRRRAGLRRSGHGRRNDDPCCLRPDQLGSKERVHRPSFYIGSPFGA